MELGLAGRVALVTGGSRGIGQGIAAELAREGARVAIAARTPGPLEDAARAMGALAVVHDSADLAAIPGLVDEVERELGPIDILVCNTGGPPGGDPLGFTTEQWQAAHTTLVLAPMTLIERVVPGMRERGFGRVLTIGSTTVREPSPRLMLSSAHRPGLVAAFKTLAHETARDGVTFNTIHPGLIETDRLLALHGSAEQAAESARLPAGRVGTVEELAAVAAFLCSERASYVSGETIAVDGAWTRSV